MQEIILNKQIPNLSSTWLKSSKINENRTFHTILCHCDSEIKVMFFCYHVYMNLHLWPLQYTNIWMIREILQNFNNCLRHIKQHNSRNARRIFFHSFDKNIDSTKVCNPKRRYNNSRVQYPHKTRIYSRGDWIKGVPYIFLYKLMWDCVCDCVWCIFTNVQRNVF